MTNFKALYEQSQKENTVMKKVIIDLRGGLHEEIDSVLKVAESNIESLIKDKSELKEENEKLKSLKQSEINEIVKSDEGTMKLYGDIAKLMGENEKLKKDKSELEEQLEVDDDGFACSDWFEEKLNKHIHFALVEEGGEYNHFDTITNKRVYHLGEGGSLDEIRDSVGKLEKENEIHVKQIDELIKLTDSTAVCELMKLKEENEKLKKENQIKKIAIDELISCELKNAVCELMKLRDDNEELREENEELTDKNEELKAENEELTDENGNLESMLAESSSKQDIEELNNENQKLREENEKLKIDNDVFKSMSII